MDTIRVKPIDSAWVTLGTGRYRGVVPESIESSANSWGPDQCSFQVKVVEPGAARPDLLPYTPVEVETDGMLVWAGRVKAKPSDEQNHAVQCEGWQYHLDDNVYSRAYVHTRLSDYRDQRTFLGSDLTKFRVAGGISNDRGAATIGWPTGTTVAVGDDVGVTLDLGANSSFKRAVMTWESSNNAAGVTAVVRNTVGETSIPGIGSFDNAFTFVMNTGASGTSAGTMATARRYMHVFLNVTSGGTYGADVYLRITGLKIFRLTAYESGNASILTADTVIRDALTAATLLNQSTALIQAGSFVIPEYVTSNYQSCREVIESVNAYENYRQKIGGADLKTLVYDPKPSAPLYEVGEAGAEFADASVSGEDIYTTVVTTGTGPDGANLESVRSQTGTLVDRQGGGRTKLLPIRSAMTSAVADRFGDLWLTEHRTAPFAGKLTAGSGIRRHLGGASVPPHALLLAVGEKIRLMHRLDPDTGGWGRDGRIAAVSYNHTQKSVSIDIDDQRDRFENVLARYGILVDQFT